ncbi:MAG: hypothetical protein AB7S99_21205 [Pseudodonghicola sp.]
MHFRRLIAWLFAVCAVLTAPAGAQTPEDLIRWVYLSYSQPGPAGTKGIGFLSSPSQRAQFFSRRQVAFFAANDSYRNSYARSCFDFALDIPGNGFNAQEIAQSLVVTTQQSAGRKSVTARFRNFEQLAQITYDFIEEDGFIRIDDIAGPGWRLSALPCAPQTTQTPAAPTGRYCFDKPDASVRLDLQPDGRAHFVVTSSAMVRYTCFMEGVADPAPGGWLYADREFAQGCTLKIITSPDGGVALSDPTHQCKAYYCGQAASLDGIRFDQSDQIHCRQTD